MKAIALVHVQGGVAYTQAPDHVDIRTIDSDNIKAGDPPVELPRGIGFEKLVEFEGLEEGKHYVWE